MSVDDGWLCGACAQSMPAVFAVMTTIRTCFVIARVLVESAFYLRPTDAGENMLISRASVKYAMAFCALTLLPDESRGGAKPTMAPFPGTTARMAPPTPLLAGTPTFHAHFPDPSYRPAI